MGRPANLGFFRLFVFAVVRGHAAQAGPLHDAVRAGDLDQVNALIAAGAAADDRDLRQETPLIVAALISTRWITAIAFSVTVMPC